MPITQRDATCQRNLMAVESMRGTINLEGRNPGRADPVMGAKWAAIAGRHRALASPEGVEDRLDQGPLRADVAPRTH